jgi:hypothetical protein
MKYCKIHENHDNWRGNICRPCHAEYMNSYYHKRFGKDRFYITDDFDYGQDMNFKLSGIYVITNKLNLHKYIGSSVNIFNRLSDHKWRLYHKNHHSIYLQRAVNKYGIENFKVSILEKCTIDNLNEKEIYWIGKLKPEYNIAEVNVNRVLTFSPQMKYNSSKSFLRKRGYSKVEMLNKNGDIVTEFDSLWTAAGFIQYNGLSKSKLNTISSKISDIANGNKIHYGVKGNKVIAETAYGYKWQYV